MYVYFLYFCFCLRFFAKKDNSTKVQMKTYPQFPAKQGYKSQHTDSDHYDHHPGYKTDDDIHGG